MHTGTWLRSLQDENIEKNYNLISKERADG